MKKSYFAKILMGFLISVNLFAVEVESYEIEYDVKRAGFTADTGNKTFNGVNAFETVKDMTLGWNLGNTMDAPTETGWGQPKTTKAMIDGIAKAGFKTIRIPVSWSTHIDEDYTISAAWTYRVKEIVDWAIEDGLYVIINIHHDNWTSPNEMPKAKGFYPNSLNYEESARYITNVWAQICVAFNNGYDEHLIFETLNEPRLRGTSNEWNFQANKDICKDAAETLNKLNQVAVNTIRSSGGNNQKRFIMCPGLAASPDSAMSSAFQMPEDDEPGKLILSVHMYSPYNFAMASPGETVFTSGHKTELRMMFGKLNTYFVKKGYPVVIGEMGAVNKNNLSDRVAWADFFVSESRKYGMTSILWDNGSWQVKGTNYNEKFGYYARNTQVWYFPEIIQALVKAAEKQQK